MTSFLISVSYAGVDNYINGIVVDSTTKKPIVGVNVFISNLSIGAQTNKDGLFRIDKIPDGTHDIHFRMIGYKEHIETKVVLSDSNTIFLNISIHQEPIQMKQIEVISSRFDREMISTREIRLENIRLLPTLSEHDIIQAVQILPGVMSTDDYTNKIYIRGADADQTVVLLDNIPIINPLHFMGLFSPFHIDALEQVQVKSGGFSVKYGDSASGIIDILTSSPTSKTNKTFDLSLLNVKSFFPGKLGAVNYFLALRRSYEDLLFPIIFNQPFPVAMSDALGKIIIPLSSNQSIDILGFYSNDILMSYSDYPYRDKAELKPLSTSNWGNRLISTRWNFVNEYFQSSIQAGLIRNMMKMRIYKDNFGTIGEKLFFADNILQHILLLFDNKYALSKSSIISWGIQFRKSKMDYYWDTEYEYVDTDYFQDDEYSKRGTPFFFDYAPYNYNNSFSLSTTSGYLQYSLSLRTPLKVITGIRTTLPTKQLDSTFEPRIQLIYQLKENTTLNASISHHVQHLITAKEEGGFDFTFAGMLNAYDIWFPLIKPYKPVTSDQFILGMKYNDSWGEINIEGYFNIRDGLVAAIDSFPNFEQGSGHSEGIEILIKKQFKKGETIFSYNLSRSVKNVNGTVYYPKYDRRHDIDININYKVWSNTAIALRGKWGTGTPYTPLIGKYYARLEPFHRPQEYVKGQKNSVRLPDYVRLDLQILKDTKLFNKEATIFLQIQNITNNQNILYWGDLRGKGGAGGRFFPLTPVKQLPIIPTIGVKVYF